MKINIIDPTSVEFNRGSFCYSPYLLHNWLMEEGHDVQLYESFLPEDLDNIRDADANIVTVWSYPQVDVAVLLEHFLPFETGKDNVYFAGYTGIITHYGLRHVRKLFGFDPMSDATALRTAMYNYPKYYLHFKRLLLSDCDMHLQDLDKNRDLVYPMFTTYGCPNGCAFCPSTVNTGKRRFELTIDETMSMLEKAWDMGVRHIHFTDEDFFYDIDRAYVLLEGVVKRGWEFQFIALGAAEVVKDFIQKYGTEIFDDAGLKVLEIGFESGNAELSKKMGSGKSLSDCELLATHTEGMGARIFWLVLTFFPGETLQSIRDTGKFMLENGFEMEEVVGRLRTNGTKGGLGQFFQPYHGTALANVLRKNGLYITERPIRLLPSYLPNSFLDSTITTIKLGNLEKAQKWLHLYNITNAVLDISKLEIGLSMRYFIEGQKPLLQAKRAIAFAILARMDVIS